MPILNTDYFTEVGNPGTATALAAPGHAIAGTIFNVTSTANWPTVTSGIFAVDTFDIATGLRVPGSYTEWQGIVTSSTAITSATLRYGTDQNYAAGSTTRVYIPVASSYLNRLSQGIRLHANQDGSLITAAVQTALAAATSTNEAGSTMQVIRSETQFDHVASGGVWAGLGYGSTLTASMTALVCYINGFRQTVATLATRTFTASKDTYIDVLYNVSGVATLVYTEVANNAASPALAASSVRIGIIITGATNILNAGSINQGSTSTPVVAGVPLLGADSLGNVIYPRGGNSPKKTTNQVKFSVYRTAAQNSLTTPTVVLMDTKLFDTSSNVDVATNKGRFTAPIAGYYHFDGLAGNTVASATTTFVYLYKNGSMAKRGTGNSSSATGTYSSVSGFIQLAANDYVELYFVGGGGSTMGIGQTDCYFDGFLVSAS